MVPFFPDDQRSGFFKARHEATPAPQTVKVEHDEVGRAASVCNSPYEPSIAEAGDHSGLDAMAGGMDRQTPVPGGVSLGDANVSNGNGPDVPSPFPDEVDDSDSSSSGSDALSSDHSVVADPPARVKRFRARIPSGESWYVHSKSHLIHRYEGTCHNALRFLVCGKLLTDAYALCTEATAWNTLCRSCNRR